MDKMTIEKARERSRYCNGEDQARAFGFIEGWQSRQAEVDELTKIVVEWELFKAEHTKEIGSSLWLEESK
jgi:hypothetical protein